MKTPAILANGSSTGYGLGLYLSNYRGVETLHHGGGGPGRNSQMLKVGHGELDVVVLLNRRDVSAGSLVHRILDACLPDLKPVEQCAAGTAWSGVFHSNSSGRVIEMRLPQEGGDGPSGLVASIDGVDLPMEWDSDGRIWPAGDLRQHFSWGITNIGGGTTPDVLALDDFGNVDKLSRVSEHAGGDIKDITGRYRTLTLGIEALIFGRREGLILRTLGRFGPRDYRLERLAGCIFKSTSESQWNLILVFTPSADGFEITSWGTRLPRFTRVSREVSRNEIDALIVPEEPSWN